MKAQRFAGYVIPCEACGHQSRAATLLVARAKDREHAVSCDAEIKKKATASAASAAQLKLF